jgi:hypothetical protein
MSLVKLSAVSRLVAAELAAALVSHVNLASGLLHARPAGGSFRSFPPASGSYVFLWDISVRSGVAARDSALRRSNV